MTHETLIRLRCNAALAKGWCVALCRLPYTKNIIQFYASNLPQLKKLDLDNAESLTFAFAPYASGNLAYLLTPDCVAENENVISGNADELSDSKHESAQWHILQHPHTSLSKTEYIQYVNAAKQMIQSGEVLKIVAARSKLIRQPPSFDVLQQFFDWCSHHESAYVFLFSSPVSGTWLGATPELLLSYDKKKISTVALAGTKAASDATDWGKKEQDEHAWVEAFIDDAFEQLKIDDVLLSEIEETTAGSVKHMRSTFSWSATDEALRSKFHKLLGLINPTPAVCGLPMMGASLFIAHNEGMERRFYSGFNGILSKEQAQLYVTLRCMELQREGLLLYAGAGITADSSPEAEWEETERKMQSFYPH